MVQCEGIVSLAMPCYYSPTLKKWGYTGFGLSVITELRNSVRFFCVRVFSGTIIARIIKLGIHMDNELLYCGIENQTPCSYSFLYLSIFLSFTALFVSQFSPKLCKLESLNMYGIHM